MSPACALPLAGMFASVQLKHELEFSREFRWWLRIQKTQAPALFHDETGPVKRGFILRTACETRHCDLFFARPGHRQTLEGLTDHRQLFERRSADQQWKRRFSSFTAGSPATQKLTLSLDLDSRAANSSLPLWRSPRCSLEPSPNFRLLHCEHPGGSAKNA